MLTIDPGRELVQNFIKNSEFNVSDLAKTFGITKQEAGDFINGKRDGEKASNFILGVIHYYKL
ncbi:XRE family transcriptional regulator [Lactobacillus sp. ESL0679]|uniref:XRE family transcriptional regulator n=1 Tax=Lactobacillus sp. ESL0679 TaxID=2983209 RepID=UPI0023F62FD0|nr:XRE family transcriptional regulator [Lactobacillus sp. ESL0679]MDF7683370.1 XRE family transcriptional regulator [Lactobacillus sp. ESL0679]